MKHQMLDRVARLSGLLKQRWCPMNCNHAAIIIFAMSSGCTDAYGLSASDQKDLAFVGATVVDGIGAGADVVDAIDGITE